ncbi:hypothetical protein LOK49_LG09G01504 [Camellia lanceoleosa]|uniref:Uncharacterized protein n=1 Tax=Camellia lanceoleosa TaxID=1840588 RepID=A0ACC0GM66_9ERIC|nr:hypothetical protein LOK49_LG09G01504 [Camellia lanceoleosa]
MVFTPLLTSTGVGTLEFRSVVEPVGHIQPALAKDLLLLGCLQWIGFVYKNKIREEMIRSILEEENECLLHCVVIGGGPTRVEFSGELSNFIMRDVSDQYTHVKNYIHVTLIEYGVRLVRGVVKEVHPKKLVLSDGSDVPYGLLVWSTRVGPSESVKSLNLSKALGGRIGIDEWLRVPSTEDVFAIKDCASFLNK